VPVVAPNLDDVARIVIRFKTLPSRGADDARGAVVLSDQVFVREVDPNAGAPNPSCE